MAGQTVAYIRAPTTDQNTERSSPTSLPIASLPKRSVPRIVTAPSSRSLAYLHQGDELHVHSIDRLARNLRDLEDIFAEVLHCGATIRFHKEGLIFSGGDSPFQVLQLQIIGAVAQFERALIRERQREGIEAAKKDGKHLGRRASLTKDQVAEIRRRKDESKAGLAKEFKVCR